MGKISQYLEERAKWKKYGKPLRSAERIEELFNICDKCPMFQRHNKTQGECAECGCNIKQQGTWLNKLAWGTTRCPLPTPKWTEEEKGFEVDISISQHDLEVAEAEYQAELNSQPKEEKEDGDCGCGK